MLFVLVGAGLLVAHFAGWGPMAGWNWNWDGDAWKFAAPFVLALLWWKGLDVSGVSGRRATAKEQARQAERQRERVQRLGRSAGGESRRPPSAR